MRMHLMYIFLFKSVLLLCIYIFNLHRSYCAIYILLCCLISFSYYFPLGMIHVTVCISCFEVSQVLHGVLHHILPVYSPGDEHLDYFQLPVTTMKLLLYFFLVYNTVSERSHDNLIFFLY